MLSSAGSDKSQELVGIASRLFYEQGYGATGIKQVIEEAGIAKGTFYSHFRSKEELGLAWLKERHGQWVGWLEERVGGVETAGERLVASFDFLKEWMEGSGFRGCAFINTMAETPDGESRMRVEVAAHKGQLRQWFERQAGEHFEGLSAEAAMAKGRLLFVLFEGALVESQLNRDAWPIETVQGEVRSLLGMEE